MTKRPLSNEHISVKVFIDESGNHNPDRPLLVGATAIESDQEPRLSKQITELQSRLVADYSQWTSEEECARFSKIGFHRKHDMLPVRVQFEELISHSRQFSAFILVTDRQCSGGLSERRILFGMYCKLIAAIAKKISRRAAIEILFESGEDLPSSLNKVASGVDQILTGWSRNFTRSGPSIEYQTAAKGASQPLLAVTDYLIGICGSWIQAGAKADLRTNEFRTLTKIEPCLSMFYSYERGLLSSHGRRISSVL